MDKIDVLDHGFLRLVDSMGSDLSVSRAARVSYDAAWRAGEDAGSDARLIRYLWKNGHTSPFEAVTFTFEVKAPIFVFRQWHRHRTWCLSGDTMISFERPDRLRGGIRTARKMRLDELYRKWSTDPAVKRQDKQKRSLRDFNRDRIRQMQLRVLDERTQEFTVGHICDVIASGIKEVFEIELKDGKRLKCSKDHQLLTTDGWRRLEDAVGMVRVGPRGVVGMTKTARVMTNGYIDSHVPWNKGLTGYRTSRIVTEAEKEVIRKARSGPNSNFWKGGISSKRANIAQWTREQAPKVHAKFDYTCQNVGCRQRGGRLHAHHIKPVADYPDLAQDFDNLISLCERCHRICHGQTGDRLMCRAYGQTLRPMASEIVLIRVIGEAQTYDISVAGDNHNFVANGVVVHNSYNELSARYRELPEEFYVPQPENIGVQSKDNKQGRDIEPIAQAASAARLISESAREGFSQYRRLLSMGVPRELARSVLPVATYSHMFATVDLLNLMKFFSLRSHSHAQWEIRQYSDAMIRLVEPIVPVCIAAWRESSV